MQGRSNITYEKAFKFSLLIIDMYKNLTSTHKEFILSKQLLKSGTSIGANIAEANGAISVKDFSSKISIAYKECLETKYWINLLQKSGYITDKVHEHLFTNADELAKILFSILKSSGRVSP